MANELNDDFIKKAKETMDLNYWPDIYSFFGILAKWDKMMCRKLWEEREELYEKLSRQTFTPEDGLDEISKLNKKWEEQISRFEREKAWIIQIKKEKEEYEKKPKEPLKLEEVIEKLVALRKKEKGEK